MVHLTWVAWGQEQYPLLSHPAPVSTPVVHNVGDPPIDSTLQDFITYRILLEWDEGGHSSTLSLGTHHFGFSYRTFNPNDPESDEDPPEVRYRPAAQTAYGVNTVQRPSQHIPGLQNPGAAGAPPGPIGGQGTTGVSLAPTAQNDNAPQILGTFVANLLFLMFAIVGSK